MFGIVIISDFLFTDIICYSISQLQMLDTFKVTLINAEETVYNWLLCDTQIFTKLLIYVIEVGKNFALQSTERFSLCGLIIYKHS